MMKRLSNWMNTRLAEWLYGWDGPDESWYTS
jgi:hypothetical protein